MVQEGTCYEKFVFDGVFRRRQKGNIFEKD